MFQLKVRSYGICPSLPGLFHLALKFHPCCHKGYELLLSLCCIEFHCKCITPLICWWALRLLPVLGYCKLCCLVWGLPMVLNSLTVNKSWIRWGHSTSKSLGLEIHVSTFTKSLQNRSRGGKKKRSNVKHQLFPWYSVALIWNPAQAEK